jgi:hypothetical protein
LRAPKPFHLLYLPYDVRYRVYGVYLLSTGETSLNMISCNPKSKTTRDPLVSYLGRVGSPINHAIQSWRLQHNIHILQTCKTVIVEKTPILYRRNTFSPDPQLSQTGKKRAPYTKWPSRCRNRQKKGGPLPSVAPTPSNH